MRFSFLFLYFNLIFWAALAVAAENTNAEPDFISGVYSVENATLNETHCDRDGRPIEYASKFFKVTRVGEKYNLAICNGDNVDDLQCMGGFRSTDMEQGSDTLEGYQYSAQLKKMENQNYQCQLHALRRAIKIDKTGTVRYERTDWLENLSDFIAECNEQMAHEYSDARSLKCHTHISITGRRILPDIKS